jgi:hypothetical protein
MYIFIFFINNKSYFFSSSDYDHTGQGSNGAPWYCDKQNKRKKKGEGTLGVDPNVPTGDATSKSSFEFNFLLI